MTDHRTDISSTSSETPDHLRTTIPSGGLAHGQQNHPVTHGFHDDNVHDTHGDAQVTHSTGAPQTVNEKAPADEGDDEDIDALIAELESEDGDLEEEEGEHEPGMSAKPIPEELLNTDTRKGLTSQEVIDRRKKFGLNQMAEEKENLIKKFLGYFVGPIQFVMEVRFTSIGLTFRLPPSLQQVFKIG
jgi:H+-transporting ATPase